MNHQPNTPASLNEAVGERIVIGYTWTQFNDKHRSVGACPTEHAYNIEPIYYPLAAPAAAIDAREQGGQCQYAADVGMAEYWCVGKCQYAHATPRAVESSEAVHVETVATVVRRKDGLELKWLIEGGISAMVEGETLLICAEKS